MSFFSETIEENIYCTIATVTPGGLPWSTPVFYACEGDAIYWWSSLKSEHSINILQQPEVFITIFNSKLSEGKGKGLYIQATAKALEKEDEVKAAIEIYNNRADKFKLSLQNSSGPAPRRIFQARIKKVWTNIDAKEGDFFIDARKEIKLP